MIFKIILYLQQLFNEIAPVYYKITVSLHTNKSIFIDLKYLKIRKWIINGHYDMLKQIFLNTLKQIFFFSVI